MLYLFLLWVARSALRTCAARDEQRWAGRAPDAADRRHGPAPGVAGRRAGRRRRPAADRRARARAHARHGVRRSATARCSAAATRRRSASRTRSPPSRHARLTRQGGIVVLEDLGSTNGTYLNEELARRPAAAAPGRPRAHRRQRVHLRGAADVLRVAEHVERTDTGRQRRANEDAFYARAPLFAVADGMGGAQAGEVASQLAVEVARSRACPTATGRSRSACARASRRPTSGSTSCPLGRRGRAPAWARRSPPPTSARTTSRSPTSATAAATACATASFERLTDDHSLVEELVRQGKLTPEEAEEHPQRSIITRALGPEAVVEADALTVPGARRRRLPALLRRPDVDGPRGPASAEVLRRGAVAARRRGATLIDAANDAGGRDNITVVLFRLEEVGARRGRDAADVTPSRRDGAARRGRPARARAGRPRRAGRGAAPAAPAERRAPRRRGARARAGAGGCRGPASAPSLVLVAGRHGARRRLPRLAGRLLRRRRATTAS